MQRDTDGLDDDELVRLACSLDHAALDALIRRHYRYALRYARNMLGDQAAAEDAVQETFVRAWRALPLYEASGKFRGWLLRILVNRCRSAAAKRHRVLAGLRQFRSSRPRAVEPESIGFDEFEPRVHRALRRLPAAQREAVLLRYVEDWSFDEIATATGSTIGAVKMRISRGRRQLARDLEDRQ